MLKNRIPAINPIIVKELRSRMRGSRPFITLTVMLIILGGITFGIYRLSIPMMNNYSGIPVSPQVGQAMFTLLSFLLLLFICIITPAETSGAISGEKEQLTYEMLLSTPMHPSKILGGKLFSALSYIFLLIFAAIPIASMIFMFGGVSLRDMLKALIVLVVVAVTLGAFGILMSSLFQRSSRATVISYIIIAVIVFGSLIIYVAGGVLSNGSPPRWILALNPFSALASAITSINNPYNSILGFVIPFLGADFSTLRGDTIGFNYIPRPLYHYSLPLYGLLSIAFYFISSRLIIPTKKRGLPRKDVLFFLAAVLVLLVLTIAGYYVTADNYEQASFGASDQTFFSAPIIGGPAPLVEVEVEVQPAILVENTSGLNALSIEDQIFIYSTALRDLIETFSSDRSQPAERLFLVSTITQTDQNETNTFLLPTSMQLGIAEKLSYLSPDISWVGSSEAVFNNLELDPGPGDYVIGLGDIEQVDNEHALLYLTISVQGVVEQEIIYTLVRAENGPWEIDSYEKVSDVNETN